MELNQKVRRIVALVEELTEGVETPSAERIVLTQSALAAFVADSCLRSGQEPSALLSLSERTLRELVTAAIPSHIVN